MWVLAIAAAGLLFFAVAVRIGGRDLQSPGQLSRPSFLALFGAYSCLSVGPMLAAWQGVWPLPVPTTAAVVAGAICAVTGGAIHVISRVQFRSFRLAWGLALDRLHTGGIYRFSRNPQVIGLSLFLGGVALLGRSGAAMCLVLLFWLCSRVWIGLEERALVNHFGETYQRYQAAVPRFF
ncbi:MAG TPA: methyltransferase [Vicinamibacterales bacterium]|nr:methyltransferase [Vicinamibacterales bacterium]